MSKPVCLLVGTVVLLGLSGASAPAQEPVTLTLGGAARLAADRSAGVEAARYRVEIAEARLRQQRAALLPSIAATFSQGQRTLNSASFGLPLRDPATGADLFDSGGQVLGPVRSWDLRAALRQTLVDFSSWARVRAGRAGVAVADAGSTSASQQAATAAATAYVQAVRAAELHSARQADSGLAEELLSLAQSRQDAGMSTDLDVTRARARLAAATAELIASRAAWERAGLELRWAAALPLEAHLTLIDSLAGMPTAEATPSEAEAAERALRLRADVRLVETQRDAAQRQLAAIRAERLPSLAFFVDEGRTGNAIARLLPTYSFGLQVTIPLLDGLRREGRIEEQRSTIRELEVQGRDLRQRVLLDVRVALLQLESARAQLAASSERLLLAQQELALARRRFAEGVAGNGDVIAALVGLSAARTQVVDARAAFQSARVALASVQGVVTELP